MRLRKRIDLVLGNFLVIIMAILVIDVVWQVASRYLFSQPSSFTDELAGFLLVWVGMAGAAYVKGSNEHLAIDLLLTKLKGVKHNKLMIFINVLIALFSLLAMIVGGVWLVYTRFHLGQVSASLELPLGVVYMIVPASGILILYYAIDDIRLLTKENKTLKN
jgi:TRAP-type C4-dicarboxylate transport system permease small subunit